MKLARLRLAALVSAVSLASSGGAQQDKPRDLPRRPRLEAGADSNSAAAYYYHGLARLRTNPIEATTAFYWASRLDPSWAEALYARRIAFHMSDLQRFSRYVDGARYVIESKEVRQADSLLLKAMLRNPFLYRALDKVLIEELIRDQNGAPTLMMSSDPEFAGWIAYANGRFDRAIEKYGQALRKKPDAYDLHEARAQAFYMAARFDSAVTEMGRAIDALRKKDEKGITYIYESKAMYEYMSALALLHAEKVDAARDALGRALAEDLSFYIAHVRLGALALATGDSAAAAAEYGLAVELNGDDASLRYEYALLLGNLGRYDEALTHLTKATEIEPYYAPPWLALAAIYDGSGFAEQATANYTAYLARGPNEPARLAQIRKRVSELAVSGAVPTP